MIAKIRALLNHPILDLIIGLSALMVVVTACSWVVLDVWGQRHGYPPLRANSDLTYLGGTIVAGFIGRLSKHFHHPVDSKVYVHAQMDVPATTVTVQGPVPDEEMFAAV